MPFDERDVIGAWDYGGLPPNVRIGDRCWLERRDSFSRFRSVQNPGLVLGNGVRVYTWTTFNIEPTGCIEIGDGSILVGGIFMCAERITIGRNVIVSYHVTIADSDFHPLDADLRIRDAIAISPHGDRSQRPPIMSKPIVIEDDVCIGIGAIILKGVRIGCGARIHAGAVVTRDVPAGQTVAGNPARITSI
ncbi:MAG TPA: acyltransferase [Lacipirellulaceae bacterium]|nr:acyltransferase [Lacipirellulaceae bacterium]